MIHGAGQQPSRSFVALCPDLCTIKSFDCMLDRNVAIRKPIPGIAVIEYQFEPEPVFIFKVDHRFRVKSFFRGFIVYAEFFQPL